MTEFIEAFAPGMRHLREQRDLDKVFVMTQDKGRSGPTPLDLDSGTVNVVLPQRTNASHSARADRDRDC